MESAMKPTLVLLTFLAGSCSLFADPPKPIKTNRDEPIAKSFSPQKGAEYLDGVNLAWTRERKCFSCHTNVLYMMARPQIQTSENATEKELRKFLEDTVNKWQTTKPRTDYEVLVTAFALASHDATTTKKLSPLTKIALNKSWTLQRDKGEWNWPKCDWPPMEHDDYYGVAFMAVCVGIAPEDYAKSDEAKAGMDKIREYLRNHPAPDLHHRAMLLWASTKVENLLTKKEQKAIVEQLLAKQRDDGGWSLPSLGNYKRRDDSPNDINAPSDGYATGYVIYVLRQAGIDAKNEAIQKGIQWLLKNQRESGRWFTRSLNNDKEHYITNAGSAFAILALASCDVKLKE
jgi:squalene-hopene/tetraprenyl-beta-curcumene cyclase